MCYAEDVYTPPRSHKRKLKVSDTVRLKRGVKWDERAIADGREANKTAVIQSIYGENNDQVMVDRDLMGCRYWNIKDLTYVKVEK